MALLAGLGTLLAGFAIGVILMANDHFIIGMAFVFGAIPFSLAVWVKVTERT